MKHLITELKDMYKGADIYVMASGKSLDYVDDSFFDGKILIGVNSVYKRYPTTYNLINNTKEAKECMSHGHKVVTSCCKLDGDNEIKQFPEDTDYYYFRHTQNAHNGMVDIRVFDEPKYLAIGSTTVVPAIHLAYYMGAKNIIVCGVDSVGIEGEWHYEDYCIEEPDYNNAQQRTHCTESFYTVQQIVDKIRELGTNVVGFNPFINFKYEGHYISDSNTDSITDNNNELTEILKQGERDEYEFSNRGHKINR